MKKEKCNGNCQCKEVEMMQYTKECFRLVREFRPQFTDEEVSSVLMRYTNYPVDSV